LKAGVGNVKGFAFTIDLPDIGNRELISYLEGTG